MSVTVTVAHNVEFCQRTKLVDIADEPCMCKYDLAADRGDPDCHICKGTGIDTVEYYPYELNLANANHATLWHSLGLSYDYCGEIAAVDLERALDAWIGPELCVRQDVHEDNYHSYGISLEQAERYADTLRKIVDEAKRRKESVVWG